MASLHHLVLQNHDLFHGRNVQWYLSEEDFLQLIWIYNKRKTMVDFKKLYFGTLFLLGIYLKGYTDYKL